MSTGGPPGTQGPVGVPTSPQRAWHNLTRALGVDVPRELRRIDASRRRIARTTRKR